VPIRTSRSRGLPRHVVRVRCAVHARLMAASDLHPVSDNAAEAERRRS
jgi:hypothetical protein